MGNPFESVPRARDSGGSREPRVAVLVMQPSVALTTSAPAMREISELNPRGPFPCCLRFTSPVARRRCKTRYRPARCGVDRAGFPPAGFHSEVSRAHVRSPSATLSWRDKAFLHAFMLIPVQVVRTSRRLVFRLLAWNPWQAIFLRGVDQLREPLRS